MGNGGKGGYPARSSACGNALEAACMRVEGVVGPVVGRSIGSYRPFVHGNAISR